MHDVIMHGFLPAIQKNDIPASITLWPIEISDGAPGDRLAPIAISQGPYLTVQPWVHVIGVLAVSKVIGFTRVLSLPGNRIFARHKGCVSLLHPLSIIASRVDPNSIPSIKKAASHPPLTGWNRRSVRLLLNGAGWTGLGRFGIWSAPKAGKACCKLTALPDK